MDLNAVNIPIDKANLLALILETLLYGLFASLYLAATWITFQKRELPRQILIAITLIFVLSTVHLIVNILRAFEGFIDRRGEDPRVYFLDVQKPLEVARNVIFAIVTLVADAFFVFRCFVIWGRSWPVIALPLALVTGYIVAACGTVVAQSRAEDAEAALPMIRPWITSSIVMTLATNIACTGLLLFKIDHMRRAIKGLKIRSMGISILAMIVESAVVYSAAMLVFTVQYIMKSDAQFVMLDIISPLVGIAITAITLRVSLGISAEEMYRSWTTDGGPGNERRKWDVEGATHSFRTRELTMSEAITTRLTDILDEPSVYEARRHTRGSESGSTEEGSLGDC